MSRATPIRTRERLLLPGHGLHCTWGAFNCLFLARWPVAPGLLLCNVHYRTLRRRLDALDAMTTPILATPTDHVASPVPPEPKP